MRLVVDQNIPAVTKTFARHAQVLKVEGRSMRNDMLLGADALIVRSVTCVDASLLEHSPVTYVGSTTIGTDHMDTAWLEANGISWSNAPGCNADAAAQYTLAMMWLACERLGREFRRQTVGIVGCGNVGSRLQKMLVTLGIASLANDPPLEEAGASGLMPLEEVLAQDIVCLHVPLTRSGRHPTHRMLSANRLATLRHGTLLVNSARGDVIDGAALLAHLQQGKLHAALDVWPGEPRVQPELIAAATVASPHVAGYSVEGKLNGTRMIYRDFCEWAEVDPVEHPASAPPPLLLATGKTTGDSIREAVRAACPVERDDETMRALIAMPTGRRAAEFDRIRSLYPPRRDFSGCAINNTDANKTSILSALGFQLARH